MRDILVMLMVLVALGYTLRKPHCGILLWSWLGYMNPHRLCYGFAVEMPFAQITGITTLIVWLLSSERKSLPNNLLVYMIFIFILWMGLTTIFAFNSVAANLEYIKIIKIEVVVFLTMIMINTKERLHQLLWVITGSIAYFSIKGGVFTIATAGAHRVYGPTGVLEENNALAVGTLMIIPLALYLRTQVLKKWQRHLMLGGIVLMNISVIGSQSRGAFLAITVVGLYYWFQSNTKLISGLIMLVFVAILANFLPDAWYERMSTISTFNQDSSAMGRIHAWTLGYNIANEKFLGGGLQLWSKATYMQYLEGFNPVIHHAFVAHSIYFTVLGEHGWFGLFLYLLIYYIGWRRCTYLVTQYSKREKTKWVSDLAKMLRISLLAYFSGGAFLSLSYFDLPWHLLSIIIILQQIAKELDTQPNKLAKNSTDINLNNLGYVR